MTDYELEGESGEELIDDSGRNPTQRRLDEDLDEEEATAATDVSWDADAFGELPDESDEAR